MSTPLRLFWLGLLTLRQLGYYRLIATLLFGPIKRQIGALHQLFERLAASVRTDAGAEFDDQAIVAGYHRLCQHFVPDALDQLPGVVLVGFRQQQNELFATPTGKDVVCAFFCHPACGEADERIVAGVMAKLVVDHLEVVDVN
nr:hypothetical protein [Chloroflexus sp.]